MCKGLGTSIGVGCVVVALGVDETPVHAHWVATGALRVLGSEVCPSTGVGRKWEGVAGYGNAPSTNGNCQCYYGYGYDYCNYCHYN